MVDSLPGVTVVVPTLNRGPYLLDTVRDLLAQTHRPLEILIVDQSDTVAPELEALVAAHADVISHHRVRFRGAPIARNYGWQKARHELIVYVDDDIRCGPEVVAGHVRLHTRYDACLIGGGVDEVHMISPAFKGLGMQERIFGIKPGAYHPWFAISQQNFWADGLAWVDWLPGGNCSATRTVLRGLGGFDEQLGMPPAWWEEAEIMIRAKSRGGRILFDGSLRLTHLSAPRGGNRQHHGERFTFGVAHNRALMIRRYSRKYQWPVALGWSAKEVLVSACRRRSAPVLLAGAKGTLAGWRAGGRGAVCTRFETATSG